MTRMTGPDCVVMCNLINTYIHTYIHTYIIRGQSATCRGVKYVSSRGISEDFRNPTALVRDFSPSRGNLKTLPSRGIFMSRSRGIFMSPSRGISGDFRNPTALVRVFFPPEGI